MDKNGENYLPSMIISRELAFPQLFDLLKIPLSSLYLIPEISHFEKRMY